MTPTLQEEAADAGRKALAFAKGHLGTVLVATLAAVLVVLIARHQEGSGQAAPFEAPLPPVEFLYLDGPKILGLLSELEGGEIGDVQRVSKEITSVNAKASGGPFEVGADSQYENAAESKVTRTEASFLGLLLKALEDNDREGVRYRSLTLKDPADLAELAEGTLVRFKTRFLLSPGYIRPYVVVRQTATLSALFPPTPGIESSQEKENAEAFARQIGPDPRLTFAVAPPTKPGETGLKLLLPMSYHGLTEERSLLEKGRDEYTGGELTVFGMVIRVFDEPTEVVCQDEDPCSGSEAPEYTDYATREIWKTPLRNASEFLINKVSHSCEMPRSESELEEMLRSNSSSPRPRIEPLRGRVCFLRKLERQTEIFAPGAVIVPIAIFKGP
jgi:hypothetical protein